MASKEGLTFPPQTQPSGSEGVSKNHRAIFIPAFDASRDPEGVKTHVPHMDHFYDNSLQTGLMRDMAMDLDMGEHLVLLGNQVGAAQRVEEVITQSNTTRRASGRTR